MKVILSVEPIKYPLTGIGRYTYELAKGIERLNCIENFRFFDGRLVLEKIPDENATASITHNLKSVLKNSSVAIKVYQSLSPIIKKKALVKYNDYIYHGPNFILPAHAGKKVATFHDLSPFKFPDYFEAKRSRYTRQEILKALKRSDYIITVSDFIRQELNQYFNYPLEKIQTTHLAASEHFQQRSEEQTSPVLKKYHLEHQQYTLFVGTLEPRKNIISLIDAYQKLPAQLRNAYPLVISGFKGWKNEEILKKIDKAARAGWLVYLGYVPRSDIPFLFSGARVFCFPSEYEGFGLPVLEALQSGVPVVCSATSSLPEVAGKSSFYHDPKDVNCIAMQLETALSSDEHRYLAIEKGLIHAKNFDWEKCARQTVNVYTKLEML